MTSTDDVAGLCRAQRDKAAELIKTDGFWMKRWDDWRKRHRDGYGGTSTRESFESLLDDFAEELKSNTDLLESQANALREMGAERDRTARNRDMWKGQVERQAEQLTTLRARLKEAPSDGEINAAAEVMWNDRDARMGGSWTSRDPREIATIQTRATAKAALIAARAFIIEGGK